MRAKTVLPLITFEHKRDAYGFAVRPQHLQRYREYAGIYKEEEEERSGRWSNFLERHAASPEEGTDGSPPAVSEDDTDVDKRDGAEEDGLGKEPEHAQVASTDETGGGSSVGQASVSEGEPERGRDGQSEEAVKEQKESEAKEHKDHIWAQYKVQTWAQIRPSLGSIEQMMNLRLKKRRKNPLREEQVLKISGSRLPLIEEGASVEDSEDEFYEVERLESVQETTSGDLSTSDVDASHGGSLEIFFPWKEELECLVRGGLPMALRGELWQAFVGVGARRTEGYYQNLLDSETGTSPLNDSSSTRPKEPQMSAPEKWKAQIEKDLPRTFPGHPALDEDGRNALRRLLTAYARHNPSVGYCQLDAAMEFLRSKKAADDHVENINYNHLINQLLAKNRLGEVYDMLVVMMEEGITPDNATMNSALCFFCKAGMVDVAIQLYKSRAELGMTPNSWAYDELIKALCYDGSVDEACLVLEEAIQQGFFVGKKSFSILANVLCHQKKIDKVWKLLDEAIQRKMRPTTKILARYLSALCKTGKVKEAFMVPHLVPGVKTSLGQYKYTYTSLIHACLMSDMPNTNTVDILPRLLIEMQEQGHSPSRSLFRKVVCRLCEEDKYGTVLDLLNKQLELKILDPVTCYNFFIEGAAYSKKTTVAKEVYDRMVAAGTDPTVATDLLLLKGYLKSSHIVDALSFFHYLLERRKPSNKLYNIFISGLCDAGKTELAMEIWREVRNRDLIPSLQCYEDLVLRLCSSKEYGSVVDVLNDFEKTGRPVSSFLCNVLLLHSLKGQDLWRAWIQSEDVRARTSREAMGSSRRMLGSLIEFFSDIRSRENLDNLDEKMEEFYPVDTFTYNMLLRSLTMVGKLDSACHLLRKMHMKGYEPNEYCFDIIVSGFCKLGSRKDADIWMEVMHRHGFTPSGFTARVYNQIS